MNSKYIYCTSILVFIFIGCTQEVDIKETKTQKKDPITLQKGSFKHDFFYNHNHNQMLIAINNGDEDKFMKSSKWFSLSPNPDMVFGYSFQMAIRHPSYKLYKMLFNSMRSFPIENEKHKEVVINYALYFLAKSYELNKEVDFKIRFEGLILTNENLQESKFYLDEISRLDTPLSLQ